MHKTRTTIPVAMCGIPGASSISRSCTTSLPVDLLMAGMASVNSHLQPSNKRSRQVDARSRPLQRHTPLDTAKVWSLRLRNNRQGLNPGRLHMVLETHGAWDALGGFFPPRPFIF
jgi:hypothetical protein